MMCGFQAGSIAAAAAAAAGGPSKTGRFEGRLEGGRPHGQGSLTFDGDDRYTGEWRDGVRHGCGLQVDAVGSSYQGEWARDRRHGNGRFKDATGGEYEGEWTDDLRQGRGRQMWANGDWYDGTFNGDSMHGQGLHTCSNGERYEGGFHDNLRHGKGRHSTLDSSWYEGEWVRGRKHGEGLEQPAGHTSASVRYDQGSLLWRRPLCGCPFHYALVVTISYYRCKWRIPASQRQPRASAIGRVLTEPMLAGYPLENVTTLVDQEATLENIRAALDRLRTSTSEESTVLLYFDCAAAEISQGPDAGYYLCPFDYDCSDRRGSGLTCIRGFGANSSGEFIDDVQGMNASKVLFILNSCSPDTMDPDVPVGSPFFREKFFERVAQLPGRCIFSSCRMDEPTYTGVFSLLFFNAISGVRDDSSDIDNQFYAQVAADSNSILVFNIMDLLRRHMHRSMPKEYSDDVRMHPFFQASQEDNFILLRRTHPASKAGE